MPLDLKYAAKETIRALAATSEMGQFYVINETGGSEDPNTGQWTPGTPERTPCDGALVGYNQRLVDGVMIRSDDFKVILTYEAPVKKDSTIEVYGNNYAIVNLKPVNHAGQVQVYILQVRSA